MNFLKNKRYKEDESLCKYTELTGKYMLFPMKDKLIAVQAP